MKFLKKLLVNKQNSQKTINNKINSYQDIIIAEAEKHNLIFEDDILEKIIDDLKYIIYATGADLRCDCVNTYVETYFEHRLYEKIIGKNLRIYQEVKIVIEKGESSLFRYFYFENFDEYHDVDIIANFLREEFHCQVIDEGDTFERIKILKTNNFKFYLRNDPMYGNWVVCDRLKDEETLLEMVQDIAEMINEEYVY